MESFTLEQLAKLIGGTPLGSFDFKISYLQDSKVCDSTSICYVKDKKFIDTLSSEAGAVITTTALLEDIGSTQNFIVFDDPYLAYAKTSKVFFDAYKASNEAVETKYGKNVQIGQNTVINSNCAIGDNVIIHDNVSIYSCTDIGNNSIIHSGSVIGSDGFGYAPNNSGWHKIEHLGGVKIGKNVEIGAKTAVDRGALGNTVIEDGVKIDNQVHIAHNTFIGENTAIAACVGIAGSTSIGKNCTIGGGSGINGHITIVDNVHIHGMTMVTKSINKEGMYASGTTVEPVATWRKNQARFKELDQLAKAIKKIT